MVAVIDMARGRLLVLDESIDEEDGVAVLDSGPVRVCVCVCVCARAREGGGERRLSNEAGRE